MPVRAAVKVSVVLVGVGCEGVETDTPAVRRFFSGRASSEDEDEAEEMEAARLRDAMAVRFLKVGIMSAMVRCGCVRYNHVGRRN